MGRASETGARLPLARWSQVMHQFGRQVYAPGWQRQFCLGISFIAMGLFEKLLLGDRIGRLLDPIYAQAKLGAVPGGDSWLALAFNIQIRSAGLGDPPVAYDFSQRGERQERCQDGDLVGIDDPDGGRIAGVKVAGDGGKGDICNAAVEHRHADREDDCGDGPVPAGDWKTVRVKRAVRVSCT